MKCRQEEAIRTLLMKQYERYSFLLDSESLSSSEKRYFERMVSEMSEEDAPMALYQLSDYLCRYYGKKVIILLDEYDTPMQEAYADGYWEELAGFTRSLFNSTFKTNPWLERAIMTDGTLFNTKKKLTEKTVALLNECLDLCRLQKFKPIRELV